MAETRIVNLYNNHVSNLQCRGGHGESFLIVRDGVRILFDAGWKGGVLLGNMRALGIVPDEIDCIVLSHGHRDHTGGLPALLAGRSRADPIPVFAHPDMSEAKSLRILGIHVSMGFPSLREHAAKVDYRLSREPCELAPGVFTTGEILTRPEREGCEPMAHRRVDGRWEGDRVLDDLSMVLRTSSGLVILTGCCHAGLLNTCAHVRARFGGPIRAIFGGTHMVRYGRKDVDRVGDILESEYGLPDLYLNHCTGRTAIARLRDRFGPEKVRDCLVGDAFHWD